MAVGALGREARRSHKVRNLLGKDLILKNAVAAAIYLIASLCGRLRTMCGCPSGAQGPAIQMAPPAASARSARRLST